MSRKPGRPPLDPNDTTVQINVSLPSRVFDALATRALREDVSVPEVIRRQLRRKRESHEEEDEE